MAKIYLVRHGETLSNVWKTMQGWSDTPLTEKGIKQGKTLAHLLKDLDITSIYSSTSERAYDTACFINEYHYLDIHFVKALKELNFGSFETQSEYVVGGSPSFIMNFDWTKYGGENIEILTKRIGNVLLDIAHQCSQKEKILCVTHSIAILSAIRFIDLDLYEQRMRDNRFIDNCSVTILDYDKGNFHILAINTKDREIIYK